jgi:hypothetical protein
MKVDLGYQGIDVDKQLAHSSFVPQIMLKSQAPLVPFFEDALLRQTDA